jgi:hypothetical protein
MNIQAILQELFRMYSSGEVLCLGNLTVNIKETEFPTFFGFAEKKNWLPEILKYWKAIPTILMIHWKTLRNQNH